MSLMKIDEKALRLHVGIQFRMARIALGATQRDVADAVGLKQHSISYIETGKQSISLDQWYGICMFLNLDPKEALPKIDDLTTDPPKHRLSIGGNLVELTNKEVDESVRKLNEKLGKKRK
jgi:DNA-binding XRE family transcriptional regulator